MGPKNLPLLNQNSGDATADTGLITPVFLKTGMMTVMIMMIDDNTSSQPIQKNSATSSGVGRILVWWPYRGAEGAEVARRRRRRGGEAPKAPRGVWCREGVPSI